MENGVGKLVELWFAVRATRKPRSLRSVLTRIYLWGPERSRSVQVAAVPGAAGGAPYGSGEVSLN